MTKIMIIINVIIIIIMIILIMRMMWAIITANEPLDLNAITDGRTDTVICRDRFEAQYAQHNLTCEGLIIMVETQLNM